MRRSSVRSRGRFRAAKVLLALGMALATCACDVSPGAVVAIVEAPDARALRLDTTLGPVVGVASAAGQAFLGIPYAAAPTGPLRWRAPQPPAPWTEPRPARQLGPTCLQNLSLDAQTGSGGGGPFPGAEDCLTLNIYAPADAGPGQGRPVMVWIYGGAFLLGSGGQYDPSLLAARTGSIVVTFNYRLGALGFLAHAALRGEPGEGAFALMDQQAALRWVKDNIAGAGGDPRRVTLFGQSAGAWSACAQMASPGAAGLFARVILQSGSCTTPETSIPAEEAEAGGIRWAEALGCGGAEVMTCLRRKPAEEVLSAAPERRGVVGPQSWSPATGLDVLPAAPKRAFETGRFNRVPVIDGTNHDEGRLFSALRRYRGDLWTAESYRAIVTAQFGDRSARILEAYPAEAFGSPGLAYGAVLTDSLFACAALSLDRILSRWTSVHAYEFDDSAAPLSLPLLPGSDETAAFHAAEIAYVFATPWILADPADFEEPQHALSAAMQQAWGRFARRGDPQAVGDQPWRPFGPSETMIRLGPGGGEVRDFAARHRCATWAPLGY